MRRQPGAPTAPTAAVLEAAIEHQQAGRLSDAEAIYRKVLLTDPDNAFANHLLGVITLSSGQAQAAVDLIGKSVKADPNFAEARKNLGSALMSAGRLEEAAESCRRAVELQPDYAEAFNNLGVVLNKAEHFEEAERNCRRALELKPDYADAHNNLGNSIRGSGRLEEAERSYRRALEIDSHHPGAHNNLGVVFKDTGRFEESEQSCRRAVELDPGFADAHTNLALALFQLGHLKEGWEEYEWRWGSQGHRSPARAFPQPQWDGSSLEGKKIILWGEQGLGDEVRYAGMIPDLLDKGAAVSMECAERLVGLFARSFEGTDVHAAPYEAAERGEREYDFQCSFPSLGRFLRPTLEAFRRDGGYLVADPERRDFWQKRLAGLSGRPKVGIIWRGQLMDQGRSKFYATIGDLAPILTLPGVDFVNLMYDECDEERAEALELYGVPIHTWDDLDLKDDMDGVAALISGLDLAVCCLSTPGELAGALGVPTLTFLAQKSHFMMLGTADTAWHPSARYFTKQLRDPWGPVFEDLARSVKQRLGL